MPPVSLVTMATVSGAHCAGLNARALHGPHTLTKAPFHRLGRLRLGSGNLAEVTLGIADLAQFIPGYLAVKSTGLQPCWIPGSQPTAPPIVMCEPNMCTSSSTWKGRVLLRPSPNSLAVPPSSWSGWQPKPATEQEAEGQPATEGRVGCLGILDFLARQFIATPGVCGPVPGLRPAAVVPEAPGGPLKGYPPS